MTTAAWGTRFTMPRTETRLMRSPDGRERQVFIGSPLQDPPSQGYPVLYALDGNAVFATLVEAIRMRSHRPSVTGVVPALVVGLGYDTEGPYDRSAREHDYTAGAEPFLDCIEEHVKPAIARDYPVDASRQTLYGHSLGGLFVLRAMASRPRGFGTYIAVSPSIWRERELLSRRIDTLPERLAENQQSLNLMVGVGEYEQSLAPWQVSIAEAAEIAARRTTRRMVDDARELSERVRVLGASRIRVRFDEFAGEDHASVVLPAINQGLRFALGPGGW